MKWRKLGSWKINNKFWILSINFISQNYQNGNVVMSVPLTYMDFAPDPPAPTATPVITADMNVNPSPDTKDLSRKLFTSKKNWTKKILLKLLFSISCVKIPNHISLRVFVFIIIYLSSFLCCRWEWTNDNGCRNDFQCVNDEKKMLIEKKIHFNFGNKINFRSWNLINLHRNSFHFSPSLRSLATSLARLHIKIINS